MAAYDLDGSVWSWKWERIEFMLGPAAAGSNDAAVNSITQELFCSGKIKITLIQD